MSRHPSQTIYLPLQGSESETKRTVKSRNENEESSWQQSDQEKERISADVVETVGGE